MSRIEGGVDLRDFLFKCQGVFALFLLNFFGKANNRDLIGLDEPAVVVSDVIHVSRTSDKAILRATYIPQKRPDISLVLSKLLVLSSILSII